MLVHYSLLSLLIMARLLLATTTTGTRLLVKLALVVLFSRSGQCQSYGEVRLQGHNHTGRVEVFINGRWGTVCDDGFGINEAEVVCRQLGYTGAEDYGQAVRLGFRTDFSQPIWLDDLNCTSRELHLLRCGQKRIGRHDCTHTEDVAVKCMNSRNKTVLYNGKVRLRNGAYPSLGRIEVYCSGLWGVVCGDIRKEEADKVCRQLGYTGADRFGFKLRNNSGFSVLPAWLANVQCHTDELCLGQCQSCPSINQSLFCMDTESKATVACTFDMAFAQFGHFDGSHCQAIAAGEQINGGAIVGGVVGVLILCMIVISTGLVAIGAFCWCRISSKKPPDRPATIFLSQPSQTTVLSQAQTPLSPSPSAPAPPPRPPDTLYVFNESLSPHAHACHRSPLPSANMLSPIYAYVDPEPYAVVFKYPQKSEQKSETEDKGFKIDLNNYSQNKKD